MKFAQIILKLMENVCPLMLALKTANQVAFAELKINTFAHQTHIAEMSTRIVAIVHLLVILKVKVIAFVAKIKSIAI